MDEIAVHCSWADAQLLGDASLASLLPPELIDSIRIGSGSQYLDAIATATRFPKCTGRLFALYRPLAPEIAARWLDLTPCSSFFENTITLSCLAKILPFAPYLQWHVKRLLSENQDFSNLKNVDGGQLLDLTEDQLPSLLLSFFRLFTYDPDTFADFLHPALLPPMFNHASSSVRYLAIQCLCQLMRFADAFAQNLVDKHCGVEAIKGSWEGVEI